MELCGDCQSGAIVPPDEDTALGEMAPMVIRAQGLCAVVGAVMMAAVLAAVTAMVCTPADPEMLPMVCPPRTPCR